MEQIRQEVEKKQTDAQQEEEEVIRKRPNKRRKRELNEDPFEQIQQMTPVNSPVKAVKETTHLLEEGEDPPRVCPFHMEMIGPVVNNKGYKLSKCTDQPCLISVFNDDNATSYLQGVYTKIHKDIHDNWGQLLCYCQPASLPGLRQSKSENNPDRMYLACRKPPM